LPMALDGMFQLLNDTMPNYEELWNTSKDAILKNIESTRIIRQSILFTLDNARRLGVDHDTRKDVYENIPKLTLADVQKFHAETIAHHPYTILVEANRKDMTPDEIKALEKYGKVTYLTMEDIFGY
jgi:hypothetical protein